MQLAGLLVRGTPVSGPVALCTLRPCKDRHVDPSQPRQATNGLLVCLRHLRLFRETLDDTVALYATLGMVAMPGAIPQVGKRRTRMAEAPAPVRLEVLALRDPRSRAGLDTSGVDRSGGLMSALAVLGGWAGMVREERKLSAPEGPATVTGEALTLIRHLDWICGQEWVDECWIEIRQLHAKLRQVHGEERPQSIGDCPVLLGEGEDMAACKTPLFPPMYGDAVQCRGCGAVWSGTEVIRLGLILEAS